MRLGSFLAGSRGEAHYERLERAATVQEECDSDGEGDGALLLSHRHEPLFNLSNLNSRLRTTLASPWRWAADAEPMEGTINLLIRRMDNSTFVVEVRKKASMLDLKEAIQKKFQASGCQVSWPHVWGYFCLSFRDQKLLDEHLLLYKLGIGELDELVFVRHLDTRRFKDCRPNSFFTSLRRKRKVDNLKC